ncbi:hypothetical protein G9A89_022008 [Geosiphon pyriformis]|nr:hypothetical protein G9A89_022008 [Geosiphon pyriformis]
MQLVGLWQKTIIKLEDQSQADLLAAEWSILISKNVVRVVKANINKQIWDIRDKFRVLFYTLSMKTTAHDLWDFIGSVGHLNLVCKSAGASSIPKSKRAPLSAQNKFRLTKIYEKKSAPVSRPLAFGRKTWIDVVANQHYQHLRKETKNLHNNKFKVVTTPDTATLEYYQSIYTHCKQRFNIPDGIEVVKKSVYQYIKNRINNYLFGNYNISEVRSNLYNNLVHYLQLGTEDLNSETLATYFQELNFNIIEYCEEKYPVQSKYSFDFESETETSNKGKQRLKQYSRTTSNTPTLQKTLAKHLQTPEQGIKDFQSPRNPTQQQEPILTSANIIDYLQKNKSNLSESLESEGTKSEPEEITENEEEMATAYIAKIPEFTGEDNNTSPQEWLDKVQKAGDANGWIAAKMLKAIPYFLQETAEK